MMLSCGIFNLKVMSPLKENSRCYVFLICFLFLCFCPCHINLMNQPVSTAHKNTLLFISGIRVEYLN